MMKKMFVILAAVALFSMAGDCYAPRPNRGFTGPSIDDTTFIYPSTVILLGSTSTGLYFMNDVYRVYLTPVGNGRYKAGRSQNYYTVSGTIGTKVA